MGDWVDDEMHGQGKFTFASGASYQGCFEHNKFQGEGTYTFPDGKQYQVCGTNADWDKKLGRLCTTGLLTLQQLPAADLRSAGSSRHDASKHISCVLAQLRLAARAGPAQAQ